MSNNFDWQTEEDELWEDDAQFAFGKITVARRRTWFLIVSVVIGLGLVVTILYQQIKRLESATRVSVKAEVMAVHNLVEEAVQSQDTDLIDTLISDRDGKWSVAQKLLVDQDWYTNPPMFGWMSKPITPADAGEITITLSTDLQSAELQAVRHYSVSVGVSNTETVTLQHTAVYQQENRLWLLASPKAEFWGAWVTDKGEYVTLVYPRRDEVIARRLAADLDLLVDDICRKLEDISCSSDLNLYVRLDNNLNSLVKTADPHSKFEATLRLILPAPSLVGWPINEASYQAMYRGYAEQVATAVITDLVGYQCCHLSLLFQGIVDKQLNQLGIKPWPVSQTTYDDLLNLGFTGDITMLTSTPLDESEVTLLLPHALVTFLEQGAAPDISLAELQRHLTVGVSLSSWLDEFVAESYQGDLFEKKFLQFVYGHSHHTQVTALPISLPKDRLQLICETSEESVSIHTIDLYTQTWNEVYNHEFSPLSYGFLQKLNGKGNAFILTEVSFVNMPETSRFTIVEDARESLSFELRSNNPNENSFNYFYDSSAPNGQYVLLNQYQVANNDDKTHYKVIDLDSCESGTCESWTIDHRLTWSTDGSFTLGSGMPTVQPADPLEEAIRPASLYIGDQHGLSMVEVGQGYSPLWLTDEIYGYIREDNGHEFEFVTAEAGKSMVNSILSTIDLRELIPNETRPEQILITGASASPHDRRQLLFTARSSSIDDDGDYWFVVVLTADLQHAAVIEFIELTDSIASMALSPGGRYLTVNEFSEGLSDSKLYLLDRESGERNTISNNYYGSGLAWSSDGEWYVINRDNHLLVGAPAFDFRQLIFHGLRDCRQVYWLTG